MGTPFGDMETPFGVSVPHGTWGPYGVIVNPVGYRCPMGREAPIWGNGDPFGVSVPYGTWGPFGVMVIHLG